jgi:hypothetical protein
MRVKRWENLFVPDYLLALTLENPYYGQHHADAVDCLSEDFEIAVEIFSSAGLPMTVSLREPR